MSNTAIYLIGFLAQILFSSRSLIQWLLSEKHKKVVTPELFWQLSLLASFLLFIYGYLRDDFAIMLGQTLTYFIYIRNMQLQGSWNRLPKLLRIFIWIFPLLIVLYGYNNSVMDRYNIFQNQDITPALMILGVVGQVVFTFRFVYQWLYSEKNKESSLPLGFWILSILGALLILIYAVYRKDPVLLVGHLLGLVMYSRNAYLIRKTE